MKTIDIGELAKTSGVATSTLRYYEELGLIQPVGRQGLRRQYGEDVLMQLVLISLGKAAGFSLAEIRDMFGEDRHPEIHRPALHERAEALDRQIRRMKTLSNLLRHVAQCPAPSHMDCERFRKLLRVACPTLAQADAWRRPVNGAE